MREEEEAKKAEEQKSEQLRKEREKARVATRTMQTHELQVLKANVISMLILYM